jgi:hypothetical protein
MAAAQPSSKLTPKELEALADRLIARADSILAAESQATDLRTAATLIRALLRAGTIGNEGVPINNG